MDGGIPAPPCEPVFLGHDGREGFEVGPGGLALQAEHILPPGVDAAPQPLHLLTGLLNLLDEPLQLLFFSPLGFSSIW